MSEVDERLVEAESRAVMLEVERLLLQAETEPRAELLERWSTAVQNMTVAARERAHSGLDVEDLSEARNAATSLLDLTAKKLESSRRDVELWQTMVELLTHRVWEASQVAPGVIERLPEPLLIDASGSTTIVELKDRSQPTPTKKPQPTAGEGLTTTVSVSLHKGTIDAVRTRVTRRGFSEYVEQAVQKQLRRDQLDELIAAAEAENGPVDEASVESKLGQLLTAAPKGQSQDAA